MKKLYTFFLGLTICSAASSQGLKVLSCGLGIPGLDEPQLVAEDISPDGKYVCGTIEMGDGIFIANTETNEVKWIVPEEMDDDGAELRAVDNNGVAIGYSGQFGITWQFDNEELFLMKGPEGSRGTIGECITNDGSLLVGSIKASETEAAYSKDGGKTFVRLPMPPDEDILKILKKVPDGSAAKRVSGDGKVILGFIGSFAIPCLWIMNEDGEYVPDLFPVRFLKRSDEDMDNDERPLSGISAMYLGLSNNGRYVSLLGLVPKGKNPYVEVPIIYDTETKTLAVYSEDQEIDITGQGLFPVAVCNDGTFIGNIGKPVFGSYGSFIMNAGDTQAELFVDVSPAFYDRYDEADSLGFNVFTGMSADGRYITGYAFYTENYYDRETPAYYESYVIDRGEVTPGAVDALDSANKHAEAVYSIDGRCLRELTKGINIIRNSDGSVTKVLKK